MVNNPFMGGTSLDADLATLEQQTRDDTQKRVTTSRAAAVAALLKMGDRVADSHDDNVDGANAAADLFEKLAEGFRRHSALMFPQPSSLPSGSSAAQSPDPRVEELQQQVSDLQQDIANQADELAHKDELNAAKDRRIDALTRERNDLRDTARNSSNLQTHVDQANAAKTTAEKTLSDEKVNTAKFKEDVARMLNLSNAGEKTEKEILDAAQQHTEALKGVMHTLSQESKLKLGTTEPSGFVSFTKRALDKVKADASGITPSPAPADDEQKPDATKDENHPLDEVGTNEPTPDTRTRAERRQQRRPFLERLNPRGGSN